MDEFRAALAVYGALREQDAASLRAAIGTEDDTMLASIIANAMGGETLAGSKIATFWVASGQRAIDTTVLRTGVGEGAASMLVGAALHSMTLAGADVNEQTVIDLAERAAAWDRGRSFGESAARGHRVTYDLDPTHPPAPADLLRGKFILGHEEESCWFSGMTVRRPVARHEVFTFESFLAVLPLSYTTLWVGHANELVERIPVLPDGQLPREGHGVPVMIRSEDGVLLEARLLRVDREATYPARSLSPVVLREVWVVGDWTVTCPPAARRALMPAGRDGNRLTLPALGA